MNIRIMFLNSVRRAHLQHILKQLQAIRINNNAFVVIVGCLQRLSSIGSSHSDRIKEECGQ